jgi:hypothetical protein
MAFCFKLPHSHSVKFPNECFVCGRVAEKEYKIVRRQILGFGYHFLYFTLKHSRMNVRAPVCTEHCRQLTILKSTFWLLILGAIASLIFLKGFYYLTVGIAVIAYVVGRKYFPMKNSFRIYSIDRDYVLYSSNREDYLAKLCELNGADVFVRDFFSGADY